VEQPIEFEGEEILTRASIGVAVDLDRLGPGSMDTLVRNADAAMYLAKERGKGRYQMFEPSMHAAALDRLRLKADLQQALTDNDLTLVYQPIVDLETGLVSGAEALVRWHHPERGPVRPDEFIPLAEETGLIVALGRAVMQQALNEAAALTRLCGGIAPITMAINLSARQLQEPRLVAEVRAAMETCGVLPENIVLELTETRMMADVDTTIVRLHELRDLGVRLAIDDFGTGYSSLNYIRDFPIDVLKIDRSFIGTLDASASVPALTEAIFEMAAALDVDAVAEGIETAAQMQIVQRLGCRYGQGYAMHRPMPAADLERLVVGQYEDRRDGIAAFAATRPADRHAQAA
jgi:EAL domain-containing protein (putative c-di-GMP-specific phosphodiesterase class I)